MNRIFCVGSSIVLGITAIAATYGCNAQPATGGMSQSEAERVSNNIYIAGCHLPQPGITRTVQLGQPNPNGKIREQYGAKLVYPIQITWSGSCINRTSGLTNYYADVDAEYTANYYKDQFGKWTHTPFVGTCKWTHVAYQQDGDVKKPVPAEEQQSIQHRSCGLADTVND